MTQRQHKQSAAQLVSTYGTGPLQQVQARLARGYLLKHDLGFSPARLLPNSNVGRASLDNKLAYNPSSHTGRASQIVPRCHGGIHL
eukprot:1533207-Amphidinium_carterae.1